MTCKLRIAFIDYVLEPDKPGRSGLSDIVWDMAIELVNQGHEVHVIATYYTTVYPDKRVVVHNFPTPPIGYRNIIGQFWILKRATDIVKQLQPDIAHAPEYVSTAVLATLGVKAPIVLTVPGNIWHRIKYGHSFEWTYVQVLKWAAWVSAKRCTAIIAISKEMKQWWEWTGGSPEKIIWVPLGVDTCRFHFVPDARSILGIPSDQLHFLYVGRFAKEKGLKDLLLALRELRPLLQANRLLVTLIGKGPEERALREIVRREDLDQWVMFREWVSQDDLRLWYSAADALVLPSHTEAFSRTILEAMICGTPVIGSRITGTEDHIQDNVNGFLFPKGNSKELSNRLAKLIEQPPILKQMRQYTHDYAAKHLGWGQVTERVVNEVYNPIIRHQRSGL